jgi:hypothetical protein
MVHAQYYDFTLDPAFPILSTGSTSQTSDFTISYSANDPSLFNNPTAFFSFSSLAIDPTSTTYSFDYKILQVTNNAVTIEITKNGDTRITRLKGWLIIISDQAQGIF